MAYQIRDLFCTHCDAKVWDDASPFNEYPPCEECGGQMDVTWERGMAPSTDVYGCAQFSDATGQEHSSQREKIKFMRNAGYEEAGDKVGGARIEHSLKNSTFSYPGQTGRSTVSEGT
jgi:hypothetical protein